MHRMILALLFALTACSSARPDAMTQAQGHEVDLYVTPGISGQNNDVRIEIRGSRFPDIPEASISLSMPGTAMPAERVPLTEESNGSYAASNVRFPMAGKWHVSIRERDANTTREFAALDFTVR